MKTFNQDILLHRTSQIGHWFTPEVEGLCRLRRGIRAPVCVHVYLGQPSTDKGGRLWLVALQEAINENARHSWKLVGVAHDPTSHGLFLVWDTTGFFSG